MPLTTTHGYLMITLNFDLRNKYWKDLSYSISGNFMNNEIKNPTDVANTLKKCFSFLNEKFMNLIENEKKASFYIFVHNFHENSCEIYLKQLNGLEINIDQSDFAATRRILKLILEQSTKNDLIGCPNFRKEIYQNWSEYEAYLEELLYLGYQAISISEYIAIAQLFPKSIELTLDDELLNINHIEPHQSLSNTLQETMKKHNPRVVLQPNAIAILQKFLKQELNIDYSNTVSFIYELNNNPNFRFRTIDLEEIKKSVTEHFGYDASNLSDFYSGLTLSRRNVLSIDECILKNQDEKRFMYRPFLEYQIDNKTHFLIGKNKFDESIVTLTTNAMPFEIAPNEWLKTKSQRKYMSDLEKIHDKVLEEPIWEILERNKIIYDKNIKSVCPKKGNCGNIQKMEGVGEIDIILIKENEKKIYVIDCKHNRSRFDVNNWKRDYSTFKNVYEKKLTGKKTWVENNLELVCEHLNIKNCSNVNFQEYSVDAFFIINNPSIYMFNGLFMALTILEFEEFIDNKLILPTIRLENEETSELIDVNFPYFDSLEKLFNA